jgi:hypothetical protein
VRRNIAEVDCGLRESKTPENKNGAVGAAPFCLYAFG